MSKTYNTPQDLKRAIIVGETTFGKGSVQTILPMEDGSAMRLTTAKYYTPSKKTIHEKGIRPNIVATLTPDEAKDLARWRNRDAEHDRERTAQSFMVPKVEIAANGYDLSINRYKEIVYEAVEYDPPLQILDELAALEAEIQQGMAELREMLS